MITRAMVKRVAVLGAAVVMTMAGASAAFAADNDASAGSTLTYMTEADAQSQIDAAKMNGTLLYNIDNTSVIQLGDKVYEYCFYKTDEKPIDLIFSDESDAAKYAQDNKIHDVQIQDSYCTEAPLPWLTDSELTGEQYWGNLKVNIRNTAINTINLNVVKGIDTIKSDGIIPTYIEYSVNDGGDTSQIVFKSSDESVATVECDGDVAIVTGHSAGIATIRATALNGTTNAVTISVIEE